MQNSLFLLVRHGETHLNKSHSHVSHLDVNLDEDGQKQAKEAGEFISHLPFEIKHVICSPLSRAQETAASICELLGIAEYFTDDRLADLNLGNLAGKNLFENPIDEYLENPNKNFPNGESIDDFENRQNDFARDLIQWIESGKLEARHILIVTHSPIITYWYNLQHPDNKVSLGTELVRTGGIAEVTDDDVFPLFRKEKTDEEKQDAKMDPAVVLYMPPESLGTDGAKCGTCILGFSDGKCASVHADDDKHDTTINLKYGVCGLYVKGKLDSLTQIQPIVSRTVAGYINKDAPTNCNKCEYFTFGQQFGCLKIDGRKTKKGFIEAGGCCNRWEKK